MIQIKADGYWLGNKPCYIFLVQFFGMLKEQKQMNYVHIYLNYLNIVFTYIHNYKLISNKLSKPMFMFVM